MEDIDLNKVIRYTLGFILVVAVVIAIRKKLKRTKNEAAADAYLSNLKSTVKTKNLSYTYPSWYEAQAISLAAALDASFGNNGGWMGCDQQGVYAIIELLKTKDDAMQLEESFGTRELNASWLKKKKPMTLRQAVQELMTTKEHKKVNEILTRNGVDYTY